MWLYGYVAMWPCCYVAKWSPYLNIPTPTSGKRMMAAQVNGWWRKAQNLRRSIKTHGELLCLNCHFPNNFNLCVFKLFGIAGNVKGPFEFSWLRTHEIIKTIFNKIFGQNWCTIGKPTLINLTVSPTWLCHITEFHQTDQRQDLQKNSVWKDSQLGGWRPL